MIELLELLNFATIGAGNADAENGVSPSGNYVRARIEVGGCRSSEIYFTGFVRDQTIKISIYTGTR
jgi:hypothetical protein